MTTFGTERAFTTVGALKIAYESTGAGGPPVMLIPGGFEDRTYFAPVAAHLARSHRVVSLDLRGQGASDAPDAVSMESFEDDVIAVAEAAGVQGAILCGHSAAGAVALSVAHARPDLARGVVMLDGVVFFPEAARQEVVARLLPQLEGERWLDALRGYFGRTLDPLDPPQVVDRVMSDLSRWRPEVARSFIADLYGPEFPQRQLRHASQVTELHCPLMYVHARVPADLRRLQELRPDALVGRVVGSGHYLMLTAADQVNAMLDRFLEVVDRTSRAASG